VCLLEARLLKREYAFVKRIGQGAQATVDHFRLRSSGQELAIKTYKLSVEDPYSVQSTISVLNEIEFLRDLKHCKNIVQLYRVFYEKNP
jgi:serine/threonine protein kinase